MQASGEREKRLAGTSGTRERDDLDVVIKQQFERRVIKEVKGTYNGPKKVKASGKAAGTKKKKIEKKKGTEKKAKPAGKRPNGAKRESPSPVVSQDGMAPLKRKKPTAE